jgi:hypothetical protein
LAVLKLNSVFITPLIGAEAAKLLEKAFAFFGEAYSKS